MQLFQTKLVSDETVFTFKRWRSTKENGEILDKIILDGGGQLTRREFRIRMVANVCLIEKRLVLG